MGLVEVLVLLGGNGKDLFVKKKKYENISNSVILKKLIKIPKYQIICSECSKREVPIYKGQVDGVKGNLCSEHLRKNKVRKLISWRKEFVKELKGGGLDEV